MVVVLVVVLLQGAAPDTRVCYNCYNCRYHGGTTTLLLPPKFGTAETNLSCRVYEEASQAAECKEEEAFCYVSQPQPNLALEKTIFNLVETDH